MRKYVIAIITAIISIILVASGIIIFQNSYDMEETEVFIPTSKGVLKGTLALPKHYTGKLGLVVFIHGDGPINTSHDEGYKPLWEKLASVQYASLSWSKPGIDGSEGNWLHQSMDDRAQEAIEAIQWVKEQLPMIDEKRIGLWGASQGGWVVPKIVTQQEIAFNILVSPAINWKEQGRFNTIKTMERDGATPQEIQKVTQYNDGVLDLLASHVSYEEYIKLADRESISQEERMSRDRWTFVQLNFQSDATADLAAFHSPVMLILGGHDLNVDVENTRAVYEQQIPPSRLSVLYLANVDHSMIKQQLVNSKLRLYMTGLFAPRSVLDASYYTRLAQFVTSVDS